VGCHRYVFLSTLDLVKRDCEAVNYNADAPMVELAIIDCSLNDSIRECLSSDKGKLKIANPRCYSRAAWMKNSCDALSYSTLKTFGLQHVWQSST
jgi:hypothetical protein